MHGFECGRGEFYEGSCMSLIEDEENLPCMFLIGVGQIEFQEGARGFDWERGKFQDSHACF